MASVEHFRNDAENITEEIEKRFNLARENARFYFTNARYIQKIFRGYITRKHVEKLNENATIIQKNWRAFIGRKEYRERLKERYDEMCWTYYNLMATRIQRIWRGWRVRKNIFDYYELKSWMAFVRHQNKLLKKSTDAYRDEKIASDLRQRENEAKEWIVYILFKLHHLVRTHQLSGIYSLPRTANLSEIEAMMKCLKYKDFMKFYDSYMEDLKNKKARELPPYILQRCKYPAHFEREWYEHKKPHKSLIFARGSYHDPKLDPVRLEISPKKVSSPEI